MPSTVPLENVAFEGFMVRREVIDAVGLPDPSYFIFYDDCDFAIRIRRAGFEIVAVRDAAMTRQLAFDQQHDLSSWKGYYMYRNLFACISGTAKRPGETQAVRLGGRGDRALTLRGGKAEAATHGERSRMRVAWAFGAGWSEGHLVLVRLLQ
jgi:GT2 family glycosyltransferase